MLSQEIWIERFISVHQNKYDYSKVKIVNSKTKIEIICPDHGSWFISPSTHYEGVGCPQCARFKSRNSQENFIERAKIIHNNVFVKMKNYYLIRKIL